MFRDWPFCGSTNVLIDIEHACPQWIRDLLHESRGDAAMWIHGLGEKPFRTNKINITVHAPCKQKRNGRPPKMSIDYVAALRIVEDRFRSGPQAQGEN